MAKKDMIKLVKRNGANYFEILVGTKLEILSQINFMDGFQFGENQKEWGSVDDFGVIDIIISDSVWMQIEEGTTRKGFKQEFGMTISEAIAKSNVIIFHNAFDSLIWVSKDSKENFRGEFVNIDQLSRGEFVETIHSAYQLPSRWFNKYIKERCEESWIIEEYWKYIHKGE